MIHTLRPNGSSAYGSMPQWAIGGGAGTRHAATSDDVATTNIYVDTPGTYAQVLDLTTYAAGGAQFRRGRIRIKYDCAPGLAPSMTVEARFYDGTNLSTAVEFILPTVDISNQQVQASGWFSVAPTGLAWTQTDVDNLKVYLAATVPNDTGGFLHISEVYVDVDVNQNPTVTISAPTSGGTVSSSTEPVCTFTYADADNDAFGFFEAALFTQAQFTVSGFDPATSPAQYRSGTAAVTPSPTTKSVAPASPQPNPGLYRYYVRVAQADAAGDYSYGWSTWQYTEFVLNVTPPNTPSVTYSADNVNRRGAITVSWTNPGGVPAVQFLTVERSADGGTTWLPVRSFTLRTVSSSPMTDYDYEAPYNKAFQYRVKSAAIVGFAEVDSAWFAPGTLVTITSDEWELKDPFNSAHNLVLNVIGDHVTQHQPEDKAFFSPVGRTRKLVVSDTIKGAEMALTLEFVTDAEFQKWLVLRNLQQTLLLVRGWTAEQWYVQVDSDPTNDLFNYSPTYRTAQATFIEVDVP